jgi:hypothetical protein
MKYFIGWNSNPKKLNFSKSEYDTFHEDIFHHIYSKFETSHLSSLWLLIFFCKFLKIFHDFLAQLSDSHLIKKQKSFLSVNYLSAPLQVIPAVK